MCATNNNAKRALEQLQSSVFVKLRRLEEEYQMNSDGKYVFYGAGNIKVEPVDKEILNSEDTLENCLLKSTDQESEVEQEQLVIKEEDTDSDSDPLLVIKKESEHTIIDSNPQSSTSTVKENAVLILEPSKPSAPYLQEIRENLCKNEKIFCAPAFLKRNVPNSNLKSVIRGPWTGHDKSMRDIQFTKKRAWLGPAAANPTAYFDFFIDDEYLNKIVVSTNKNANNKKATNPSYCYVCNWEDVTVAEFKIFIGLVLHTGTAKLKNFADYWRQHRLYKSCFPDYMTQQRFSAIMHFFTFPGMERDKRVGHSKLKHPMSDNFNNVMDRIYYPGRNLSISINKLDFDPTDIDKDFPLKVISLHGPDEPILKVFLDTRRNLPIDEENLMCQLLDDKFNAGHAVYVNNAATPITPVFAQYLLQRATNCTGIVNQKRFEIPDQLANASLKNFESKSIFYDGLHVGKFQSESEATYYVTTEFKKAKDKSPNEIPEPLAVYKKMSEPSDPHREMLNYIPCEINKVTPVKKLFIYTLMLSMISAHKLSNLFSREKLSFHAYRLLVLEHLLPVPTSNIKPCETIKVNKQHKLIKIPNVAYRTIGKDKRIKMTARRNCKNCKNSKKYRTCSVFQCDGCEGKPAFCMLCFFELHSCDFIE